MEQEDPSETLVFLVSAVHDMKNSLCLLGAQVERFLAELSPAAFTGYDELSQMLYEVKRVNHNLIQLLTLYKLGRDIYPFDPQPHALSDFCSDVAAQVAPLLRSRQISLEIDCPDELIWHFDEVLVGGVVGQALNNAANYTNARVRLAIQQDENLLELRVEDDGKGYPAKLLAAAEAPRGVDFHSGSTGLGLFFARTVAALHRNRGVRGELRLENGGAYGGGCFVLRLP